MKGMDVQELAIGILCGLLGQSLAYEGAPLWGRLVLFLVFAAGGWETVEAVTDLWDWHMRGRKG
ncbi:MAG TPA: hypothetical protein DF613_09845 [Lachnospiraceae bacterium]|nr:hypothetical protein [Lachnospiraceae bacterium]